jgi:bacterioferritin (cytochrome b1)
MAKQVFTGDPKVITALQQALVFEAHMNMEYREYSRLLKFAGLDLCKKFKEFGDQAHYWQKKVSALLLYRGGPTGFTMPTVTSPGLGVEALFTEALNYEMAIAGGPNSPYERSVEVSRAAYDDEVRNAFEHMLKVPCGHHKQIGWLKQQLNLMDAIGIDEYIAEHLS